MHVLCPSCHSRLDASRIAIGQKAECPACQTRFRLPRGKVVTYLHHTRDADGDIVFFFKDGESAPLQSSPVRSIRRLRVKPDFASGRTLGRYLIETSRSNYEVVIPKDTADHLQRELNPEAAKEGSSPDRR